MKKQITTILLIVLLLGASGCAKAQMGTDELNETIPMSITAPSQEATADLFAMDTWLNLSAYGPQAEAALAAAQDRIMELESLWSVTNADSEIYAVNHSDGAPTLLSGDTAEVLAFALEMAERTGGAMDPTLYPVLTAWGFTTGQYQIPSQKEIDFLLSSTGYEKIKLDGQTVTVPDGMELDLGAVGKGYAADETAAVLRKYGITSALLNFGGNVLTVGAKPDGSPWRIGIRNPFTDEDTLGVMELVDQSIVVSGGYERYFIGEDGVQYWHILDPDTGAPARNGLAQAAIISSDSKVCDALSTAVYVMGLEDAIEYWRSEQGFDMILVTDDQQIYITEGVAEAFTLRDGQANWEVYVIAAEA